MADYILTDTELTSVANAIRSKGGTSAALEWPSGFISAIQAIPTPPPGPEIVSFASGTDEQIVALIEAAHAGTIDLQQDAGWTVGDVRTISVGSFLADDKNNSTKTVPSQNIDIVITSFDDYMSCGCVMQFDFKQCFSELVYVMTGNNNVGGYDSQGVYTTTLPNLVNALPSWLKDLLIEFSVLASAGDQSSVIETISGNKLALRSEIEVFGTVSKSKSGEGTYVPYYDSDTRIKTTGTTSWGLRSPAANSGYGFCCVNNSGNSNYTSNRVGLVPFGCI